MLNAVSFQHHGIHHSATSRRFPKRGLPGKDTILRFSLAANVVFVLSLLLLSLKINNRETKDPQQNSNKIAGYNQKWHGGHPSQDRNGACWCGAKDEFCMCTPNLAIDLVITSGKDSTGTVDYVWLVRRRDTDQLAIMGGFVEINETVEQAVKRELMEEMNYDLKVAPTLVGMYSDPRRDNRRRTASVVFAVHMGEDFKPRAGDDVKEVIRISIDDIERHTYFSDHRTVLLDYRSQIRGEKFQQSTEGDFAADIARSSCVANAL
jgi:8-oxo-dGTP diphosphatase